jgi:endonuclease/exonuclease/phosphatase family metal-dependent hydrolase
MIKLKIILMKCYIKNLSGLLFVLTLLVGCSGDNEQLHIVTFNIRYDNPNDGINQWGKRIPLVESYFSDEEPDIIGMQEVLYEQLIDLQNILPGYSYVGTGRIDGEKGGEHTPIFFNEGKFNLVDQGQFWLSESPDIPSMGWDAVNHHRIVTWAELELRNSGKYLFFFNTHFDNVGVEARQRSADLMSEKISEIAGDSPIIVTGDFNIRRNHPTVGSALYYNLIGTFKDNNSLLNAEYISKTPVTTGGNTSTGFRPNWKEAEPGYAIDYIFVNDYFNVESYRVDRVLDGEIFISDHWPVVSVVSLSK